MKNMNETTAPVPAIANGTNIDLEGGASALTFEQLLARYDVPRPAAFGSVVKGTILPYGDSGHFYVGIGQKSDALLPKKDAGELQPGDEAEFLVVSDGDSDECVTLSFTRLQHAREVESAWSALKQLEASGDVTDVVIIGVEKRKDDDRISGVKASFRGLLKGFIPLSLVQSNQPAGDLVGSTVSVKVLKAEDKGRFSNILFSAKAASEALVGSAIASLEVGTIVTGTVTKIMLEKKDARNEGGPRRETGVLVEFLPGVAGFVHKSNISDSRGVKPSEVLKVGQVVQVKIAAIDTDTQRVSLSYKDVEANREAIASQQADAIRNQLGSLTVGETTTGRVKRILLERESNPNAEKRELGAIVVLPNGTEAFLHRNECSDSRLVTISHLMKVGDEIQIEVKYIDMEAGRVQLSYKKVAENKDRIQSVAKEQQSSFRSTLKVGDLRCGSVARTVPFGVFVRLGGGIEALLHISDITTDRSRQDAEVAAYTAGKSVDVVISKVEEDGKGHTKVWVTLAPQQA
jgi:small subunit ribosomal protein S1